MHPGSSPMVYVKFLPSEYVLRYRGGRLVAEGPGLSFFFLDLNSSACAIPIANTDTDFIFEEMTNDFQRVSVQGQVTWRARDYKKLAESLDFTVDLRTRQYTSDPMPKLAKRVVNLVEVLVKSHIGTMSLTESLRCSRTLAAQVMAELQSHAELQALGLAVAGFAILNVAASQETARALEAKTREEILKQADDALYERRNASIEQERRVKENELNTEISVEEKKKQIRETEIATRRMILEKESELERIRIDAEVELERKRQELAELRLENTKKAADGEAYRIASVMAAYGRLSPEVLVALAALNMEPGQLIAQAFDKLALNSEKIGQLNITPDLLASVLKSRGNGAGD